MTNQRTRIGLHGRNDYQFPEPDYELIRRARIETLKMMSLTQPGVFERIRREMPGMEFIVRLYDDRMGEASHPTPQQFVDKMVPIIRSLRPFATKFEIHNEPNHYARIEGWGATDANAKDFAAWYSQVLAKLRQACPGAKFGFPGLGPHYPHRDLEWLTICRQAILASDWLGCHCYWQYNNMLNPQWGLRFTLYHNRFPRLPIEITEYRDATPGRPHEQVAQLYVRYFQELWKYTYVYSASAFIASSPDPAWDAAAWRQQSGELRPEAEKVGAMARPAAPQPKAKAAARPQGEAVPAAALAAGAAGEAERVLRYANGKRVKSKAEKQAYHAYVEAERTVPADAKALRTWMMRALRPQL